MDYWRGSSWSVVWVVVAAGKKLWVPTLFAETITISSLALNMVKTEHVEFIRYHLVKQRDCATCANKSSCGHNRNSIVEIQRNKIKKAISGNIKFPGGEIKTELAWTVCHGRWRPYRIQSPWQCALSWQTWCLGAHRPCGAHTSHPARHSPPPFHRSGGWYSVFYEGEKQELRLEVCNDRICTRCREVETRMYK